MENGYGGGTISTDSLLLARGVGGYGGGFGGGYGGGYGGGGFLTAEAMANGTATKEAIDCNANQFTAGLQRVSDQAEESRRMVQGAALEKSITDAEFRSLDRQRDIEKAISDNAAIAAKCCCDVQKAIADAAKDAALCCCDAKLEACKNTSDIMAAIATSNATALAIESRGIERTLNATQAELISLRTQVACGCNCN
jgi:hypothetical protein